jgi:phosphoglycolate phosphatase-like HAD superfamily hydrolase
MRSLQIPADIKAVVFDKDGTLIDFDFMWGEWIAELARRLAASAGVPLAGRLYRAVGFDPNTAKVDPGGRLALASMAELRALTAEVAHAVGLSRPAAEAAAAAAWFIPDPAALARPLADLPALFRALRERGLRIAVATPDDRAPTAATLAALEVAPLVDALACGDDGHAIKPAPDAVLSLCEQFGIAPAQAIVVGDTAADLIMGRAAGAGLVVGVLSGVGTAEVLGPHADLLLPSVAELIAQ